MKIAIGGDHGGFDLKESIKKALDRDGIEVHDVGCFDKSSVDYPDFTGEVGRMVSAREVDLGIVLCTNGIGASMVANKYPGVRAALCTSIKMAEMSRRHNNANVLALGAVNTSVDKALEIVSVWLENSFEGGRHGRRVEKIELGGKHLANINLLDRSDHAVAELLRQELRRSESSLDLIASENLPSPAVRAACGSILGDKYASGYPGGRHYPGCGSADEIERLARDRATALFGAEHANVQCYSGTSANMAVFLGVLKPGDKILSMSPETGGHITHGGGLNLSGRIFEVVNYRLELESGMIDYDQVRELAREHKPRLICVGDCLYPRFIDFKRFREIADANGSYLMADIAHSAGLVAAGCYPNPVPCCEFVTFTTHKTLRGPRGGAILCQKRFAEDIDRSVFPGVQGGPQIDLIAAKAVALFEASQPDFKQYQQQAVVNAKALAEAIEEAGLPVLSGGTDIHMMAADISKYDYELDRIETQVEKAGILLNAMPLMNPIESGRDKALPIPMIRLGAECVTTRGMKAADMAGVADFLKQALSQLSSPRQLTAIKKRVADYMKSYPIP